MNNEELLDNMRQLIDNPPKHEKLMYILHPDDIKWLKKHGVCPDNVVPTVKLPEKA